MYDTDINEPDSEVSMKQHVRTLFSIILGNALVAFAICAFVVPNNFMLGGANGIALAMQQFLPLRLSVLTAIINSALFLLGLIFMGRQFAAASLLSTIVYPIIMAIFELLPIGTLFPDDRLTCAIFCSLCAGLGIGIVIRSGGSTGGMDIPPCILQKYKGIPVGTSLLFFDAAVVLLQVFLNGLDGILHSLLIILLMSVTVNHTVVGGEKKVQIIVISPNYEEIRRCILEELDGGVTMLDVETGYERSEQKAVFCIAYAKNHPAIREAALSIDPRAFIVTSEVSNVNGRGYSFSRYSDAI